MRWLGLSGTIRDISRHYNAGGTIRGRFPAVSPFSMLASASGYNCLQCPICARGFFHNINAWDIVEVDIFKGRSDPRIGGGSPTSLLRPRVGGRTRPSVR